MFGFPGRNGPMEMLTVGNSEWTDLSLNSGALLKFGASLNNEIYMHGKVAFPFTLNSLN